MRKTQQKRHRIPRRGPGVAELEKILMEQEGQDSVCQFQDISFSPPPPPPSPFLFQHHHGCSPNTPSLNPPRPPPPPPPPPLPRSLPPPLDYASWSNLPLFPTLNLIPPTLPTAADAENKALFPTTRKSDAQMNIPPHFFPSFQFSASSLNLECNNSMVNFIPGSASSCPSVTSSAVTHFHQIEHPSSQRSTDFNNLWTSPEEQEKMVSAKRLRPFLDDSHRDPNFESRAPIFTNMATKDSSSSSSSSLEMTCTPFNFDSSLRSGTKRGFAAGQLMSSTKRSSGIRHQLEAEDSNLMALESASSAPKDIAAFNFRLAQEPVEASQHRDEGGSASYYNKITFNSLYEPYSRSKSKGNRLATNIGSRTEAEAEVEVEDEAEAEGINLDLKL